VQPLYSSDPDDLALSDPSGASAAKDWAGWLPYAGIVCLGGDGCVEPFLLPALSLQCRATPRL